MSNHDTPDKLFEEALEGWGSQQASTDEAPIVALRIRWEAMQRANKEIQR